MENGGQSISPGEAQFLQLVSMFQVAALQQMGKLANPITNEIERNLEQAKASIDLVEMLKEKTAGNLSQLENEYLEKVLFELHMNYVDEADKDAKEDKKDTKADKADEDGGEEPAAGPDADASPAETSETSDDKGAEGPEPDASSDKKEV